MVRQGGLQHGVAKMGLPFEFWHVQRREKSAGMLIVLRQKGAELI
jgi:hypothetical protein